MQRLTGTATVIAQLLLVLVSSAVTVVGLLMLDWNAFEVALAIWLDGVVKLLAVGAQAMLTPLPLWQRLRAALLVVVFWGAFMAAHLFALTALLLPAESAEAAGAHLLDFATDWRWQAIAIGIAISYLLALRRGFVAYPAQRLALARLSLSEIKARVFVVQIAVLGMAFVAEQRGEFPLAGLLAMIFAKTVVDVLFEHRAQRLRGAGPAQGKH